MPRYRFHDFVLSERRRTLLRNGHEMPLIPRYFDLLVFLVERRHQAVHRRDIFDHVWRDVVVSDSALSQAIRTIRRVLDDDSREPRFVRTVSRHGYRFVFEDVVVEVEDDPVASLPEAGHQAGPTSPDPAAVADHRTGPDGKIVLPELDRPRWVVAAIGGGGAGALAGGIGALLLVAVPDARASLASVPVLTLLGSGCGAAGAAGVTAGMSIGERAAAAVAGEHAWRAQLLLSVAGAALGGGLVGLAAEWFGRWTLETIAGINVPVGGLLPGLAIGAACGISNWIGSRTGVRPVEGRTHGGPLRMSAAFVTLCGLTALSLTALGQPLVGGTLHLISQASAGAQTTLAPLGRLLGEQDFGPLTAAVIGTGEGIMFGAGLGLGLSRKR